MKKISGKSKSAPGRSPSGARGEATRKRILDAARRVFSRHSFHAASIRMIGAEGGFEHGIIRYYFPSKAGLFEALARDIRDELFAENAQWLALAAREPVDRGLSLYLDRFLEYNGRRPETLRIIAQNLVQADSPETIPGYAHIVGMLANTRETFLKTLPAGVEPDTARRLTDSFNALVLHYLGAASCQARILDMDPESREYRAWVKATLEQIFLPLLKEISARHEP